MNVFKWSIYSKGILSVVASVLLGLISTSCMNFFIANFFFSMFFGAIITFVSYFCLILKFNLSRHGKAVVLQQGLCISMAVFLFLFAVPLNVDRSISVWLLSKTYNSQMLSKDELQKEVVYFFGRSNFEMQRRVNEQVHLKNLQLTSTNNYQITKQGEILVRFFRFVALFFNLHKKYVDGL